MSLFANKVALITGGTKGIVKATAAALVAGGAKVVINYGRDAEAANATVEELGADNVYAVQADVSSVAGVEKLVNETVAKFSKIDILIPNAGMFSLHAVDRNVN